MQEHESTGDIHYFHKKRESVTPVRWFARFRALYGNTLLGIPRASFNDISDETMQELQDTFKDVEWRGNIEVRLNHSPFFQQQKRIGEAQRRTNKYIRQTWGRLFTAYASISGKTGRTDMYNPYTETAIIYSPNKYRALQQLGKAQHYDHAEHSTSYSVLLSLPVFRSMREYWGSEHVMEHLPNDSERREARKILEPNLGVQIAEDVGFFAGITTKSLFIPLLPAIGALIGHIHRKTTDQNIFFDKNKSVSDLAPAAPAHIF